MKVNLSEIYETIDVCFMNPTHRLIGIVLHVHSEAVRQYYDGNEFLMQIWSSNGLLKK